MNSDNDLLRQPDTLLQQPRSFQPLIWKYIFILLLIGHFIFGYWALVNLDIGAYMWEMGLLAVIPPALVLVMIDITAIASYVFIRFYHGRAKVETYAALIPIILALLALAYFVIRMIS